MSTKPKIKIPLTTPDIILEGLALLIIIWLWVYVVYEYETLPRTIPTHFNAVGEADDFGPKSTIYLLPAIATGIALLFFILQWFPHAHNLPVRQVTEANAPFQYRNSIAMLRVLKIGIVLFFFLTTHEIISIVKGNNHVMGPYFWIWLLVLIFLPIGIFLYRALRKPKENNAR